MSGMCTNMGLIMNGLTSFVVLTKPLVGSGDAMNEVQHRRLLHHSSAGYSARLGMVIIAILAGRG